MYVDVTDPDSQYQMFATQTTDKRKSKVIIEDLPATILIDTG